MVIHRLKIYFAPYIRLLGAVKPYRRRLIISAMAMVIVAGCNGATTWLIKPVIDQIFDQKNQKYLLLLSFAYPVLFFIKGSFDFLQTYLMGAVGQKVIRDLRVSLFQHFMSLDQRFFHTSKTGELASAISSDVQLVQVAVTKALTGLIQHLLSILVLTGVIFYLDWRMASMACIAFPLAVIPLSKFGKMIRHYSKKGQENVGTLTSRVVDAVKGVRVVQVFQMEAAEVNSFAQEADQLYHNLVRRVRTQALSSPVMEMIGTIGLGLVVYTGGLRVISGGITQGTFFSFVASLMLLYDPVKKLSGINVAINTGAAAAERIYALLDIQSSIADEGILEAKELQHELVFDEIYFSYIEGRPVLHNINFAIPKGGTVALVGPSGAGKSTLSDFLPRFLEPSEGRILWDGVDYQKFTIASLRSQIAMVDQQTVLFNATMRDNLRYAVAHAGDDAVWQALESADLARYVRSLPEQLDTMIGEDGVQLSGGQRQRLAIARAMIKDAPFLILDEATSSLDTASELAIQAALERLMEGRTTLLIAHRLSTVKQATLIVVMEQGEVKETGRFDELIAYDGLFAELVRKQSLATS